MKKTTLLAAVASTVFMTACGPSKEDAVKYNDHLVNIGNEINATSDIFLNQIDGHNVDSLKLAYGKYDQQVGSSLEECKNMSDFAGKAEYKNAAVEYLTSVKKLVDNEAKGIVEIMSKDSAQISDQDVTNVRAFAGTYDTEYAKALQKIQDAQTIFSKDWKFEVEAK